MRPVPVEPVGHVTDVLRAVEAPAASVPTNGTCSVKSVWPPFVRLRMRTVSSHGPEASPSPWLRVVHETVTVSPGSHPAGGDIVRSVTTRSGYGASADENESVATLFSSAVPSVFVSTTSLATSTVTVALRAPAPRGPSGRTNVAWRAASAAGRDRAVRDCVVRDEQIGQHLVRVAVADDEPVGP